VESGNSDPHHHHVNAALSLCDQLPLSEAA